MIDGDGTRKHIERPPSSGKMAKCFEINGLGVQSGCQGSAKSAKCDRSVTVSMGGRIGSPEAQTPCRLLSPSVGWGRRLLIKAPTPDKQPLAQRRPGFNVKVRHV